MAKLASLLILSAAFLLVLLVGETKASGLDATVAEFQLQGRREDQMVSLFIVGGFFVNRDHNIHFLTKVFSTFSVILQYGVSEGSLHPQDCAPRCTHRCSATSYKKPCMFFCQKCCAKCLCVPPGTYGNKQVCPCYNNWKTKSGGPKCP
ncbi:protein RSI-1-like isoform X1 [Punica granatum]|uniref:Protein RSI-1-like isoform X1 n=1 Tax=Punica granatum TaxID=22663 RepID=A0A6P8CRC1_PUNGR|nr:protein RSI-1-like isoform X1 [Punica granatum]